VLLRQFFDVTDQFVELLIGHCLFSGSGSNGRSESHADPFVCGLHLQYSCQAICAHCFTLIECLAEHDPSALQTGWKSRITLDARGILDLGGEFLRRALVDKLPIFTHE
jgi:hypothetical protein